MAEARLDGEPIAVASEMKLKAAAYDRLCAIERAKQELAIIAAELQRRAAEPRSDEAQGG